MPYAAVGVVGSLAQVVGGAWDIAWHAAIGRDTFWSPPHLLLYAGVLVLLVVGFAGLKRCVRPDQPTLLLPALGLVSAPFALAALGPVLQLVSAPFDELWHQLYGIDVTIWSPPHLLLIAGAALAPLGLALALAPEARQRVPGARPLAIVLFALALSVTRAAFGELGGHVWSRDPFLYPTLVGLLAVPFLVSAALVAGPRLAATLVVLLYTAVEVGLNSVLYPLYPHWHPAAPPIMLLLPALAIDLAVAHWPKIGWRHAAALGLAFGPLFLVLDAPVTHLATAMQWPEIVEGMQRIPPWAPPPLLGVAVPWPPILFPVAVVLGSLAGLLGALTGWALNRWIAQLVSASQSSWCA